MKRWQLSSKAVHGEHPIRVVVLENSCNVLKSLDVGVLLLISGVQGLWVFDWLVRVGEVNGNEKIDLHPREDVVQEGLAGLLFCADNHDLPHDLVVLRIFENDLAAKVWVNDVIHLCYALGVRFFLLAFDLLDCELELFV